MIDFMQLKGKSILNLRNALPIHIPPNYFFPIYSLVGTVLICLTLLNKKSKMKTNNQKNEAKQAGNSGPDTSNDQNSMLREFFIDELKDLYWAEKHLTKALPKMSKAATTDELKEAFNGHLTETEGHVSRLEQIFQLLDEKPQAKKCEAIEGITAEGETIIDETEKGTMTRDVGLIMAGQKAEHYEIASYGTMVQLAKTLDLGTQVTELLQETLAEEKGADEKLSAIAENHVNAEAKSE